MVSGSVDNRRVVLRLCDECRQSLRVLNACLVKPLNHIELQMGDALRVYVTHICSCACMIWGVPLISPKVRDK